MAQPQLAPPKSSGSGSSQMREIERRILVEAGGAEGVWDCDIVEGTLYLSPEVGLRLQLSEEDSPDSLKKILKLIHPEDVERVMAVCGEQLKHRIKCTSWVEFRVLNSKGEFIWIRARGRVEYSPSGSVTRALGVIQDLTREKALEEHCRQAQKMEAVGQFAGGVAHDFNNIIGVVLGYSDLILRKGLPDDQSRQRLEAIRAAGRKAAQITKQLLAFSRRQLLQPQVIDLNGHVQEMLKMIRCLLTESIEVRTVPSGRNPRIKVDPTSFEQVLLNLVINAKDAMPSGGTLTISLDIKALDFQAAEQVGAPPGTYAVVTVRDTGTGIPENVRDRIFEPFFSTKKPGEGTGLGLSMVYGMVRQSGGYIHLETEPSKGTAFHVHFPVTEESLPVVGAQLEKVPGGNETILVVEDEDWLRTLAYEILTGQGYKVFEVRNGEEALQFCSHQGAGVDLVFTDVVMPKRDGVGLKQQLRSLCPGIKVLFTSGYPSKHATFQEEYSHRENFICKPYDVFSLAKKVREVLDAPPNTDPAQD
jgi:two-component system, cell cycle sensor histidine kinase and response regulator CckA